MVIVAEFLLIFNLNGPLININFIFMFIFAIFTSTIIHLVCPPKFSICTFVSYFRSGSTVIPKKVMQSFVGKQGVHVYYGIWCANGQLIFSNFHCLDFNIHIMLQYVIQNVFIKWFKIIFITSTNCSFCCLIQMTVDILVSNKEI